LIVLFTFRGFSGKVTDSVTGESVVAFTIAGIETVMKLAIYYLHERAWQMLPRGTLRTLFGKGVWIGKNDSPPVQ